MGSKSRSCFFSRKWALLIIVWLFLIVAIVAVISSHKKTPQSELPAPLHISISTWNMPVVATWENKRRPDSINAGLSFRATGTEPFWSIDFLSGMMVLSSPEQPNWVSTDWFLLTSAIGGIYILENTDGIKITIRNNSLEQNNCTDGMSDQERDSYISIYFPDTKETLKGCALAHLTQREYEIKKTNELQWETPKTTILFSSWTVTITKEKEEQENTPTFSCTGSNLYSDYGVTGRMFYTISWFTWQSWPITIMKYDTAFLKQKCNEIYEKTLDFYMNELPKVEPLTYPNFEGKYIWWGTNIIKLLTRKTISGFAPIYFYMDSSPHDFIPGVYATLIDRWNIYIMHASFDNRINDRLDTIWPNNEGYREKVIDDPEINTYLQENIEILMEYLPIILQDK